MIPRLPFRAFQGDKIDPFKLISNFERMYKDLKYSRDRNISKSVFVVDFGAITSAAPEGQRSFALNPPVDIVITGVELEVYSSGSLSNVTLSFDGTGFNNVSTSVTSVSGNRGYASVAQNLLVTYDPMAPFRFIVTASANVASVKVSFSYYTQRIAKRTFESELLRIPTGETLSSLVARLNSAFSSYETQSNLNKNNQNDLRMEVITVREDANSTLLKQLTGLSAIGRTIHSIDYIASFPATSSLEVNLKDEGATSRASAILTGPGVGTYSFGRITATGGTQSQDDPTDISDDWSLFIDRNTGTDTINWLVLVINYL